MQVNGHHVGTGLMLISKNQFARRQKNGNEK